MIRRFILSCLLFLVVSSSSVLDYDFFPRHPLCINETLLKRVVIPRAVPGNETCLPAPETCRPAFENCCGFYDCVERNCGCGANGYPLGYGKKYCQIFSNYPFTGNGGKWRDATLRCLQRSLIPYSQCPPTNCDTLKSNAFDSHPFCYTSSGVCFLNPKDLLGILAITYGDVLTLDGILQIMETMKKCGFKYVLQFEIEVINQACQLKEDIRKIFMDLWRKHSYLPDRIITSSVWEFKEKREEQEVWKLNVFLIHTDDSILPDQRYNDLVSVAGTLVDFTNSDEYKLEMKNKTMDHVVSVQASVEKYLISSSSTFTISLLWIALIMIILS
jgi:hypothetical protein